MQLTPNQFEALRVMAEGKLRPSLVKEEDGWHARWRAIGFGRGDAGVDLWIDEFMREATLTRLSEDAEDQRHETLHDAWILALRSRTGLVRWDDGECRRFAAELEEWSGAAVEDVEARRSIVFRFDPPVLKCVYPRGRRGLKALGQAVGVFPPLSGMRGGVLKFSMPGAEEFLRTGAKDLADSGYTVEGADIKASIKAAAVVEKEGAPPELKIEIDGESVSEQEIRFLLDQGSCLVFFRDRWIEIDRGLLKEALRALEKGVGRKHNLISFAMGIGRVGNLEIARLKAGGWLRGLLNSLSAKGDGFVFSNGTAVSPAGFSGELRGYQRQGALWMKFLTDHGFGALLADDMGLGKTVQAIAWMLDERAVSRSGGPVLVVAPLTLLSNWRREIGVFAPSLKVHAHYGETRYAAGALSAVASRSDVVLTSYNLLVRDYTAISEIGWAAMILDEAQAVKNPDTAAARAIRALMPAKRIAITGTPIENSLVDLWSLEDFLNPGFLGERSSFRERFVKPVAMNPDSAMRKKLKAAMEPFVMRRLKGDPGIAEELGQKREIREYCALGDRLRLEYETELSAYRNSGRTAGDALALLTRLKLVCDGYPLKNLLAPELSGNKFDRLCELVETIMENGQSVLVFTQYVKVAKAMCRQLEKMLNRKVFFLHGGLAVKERDAAVRRFSSSQRPEVFVLSLKTGGYGLNLTKASHVIHYDRWWNPAVESQATDRAHRIGQQNAVFVHLMITEGTLEERIDEILRRKESLKDIIADSGSFWETVSLNGGANV